MKFKICLFLASLTLASRALRVWASASALRVSAAALRVSKRIAARSEDGGSKMENSQLVQPPSAILPSAPAQGLSLSNGNPPSSSPSPPMTVQERLSMAERFPSRHFVLRLNGVLIEITQVDEVLENAVFDAPSEGQPWPRGQRPFFLKHRATHDKVT